MAPKLHHMGITVSDLGAALEFYSDLTAGEVLGPFVKSGPAVEAVTGYPGIEVHQAFVSLPGGESVIELVEYRGGSGERIDPDNGKAGSAHPAIVVDDLDAALARMRARGVVATAAPGTATEGPLNGFRYVYLIGPDNVRVELLEAPR